MSAVPDDVPWWVSKEPNFARLQAAICRREVILGQDEVLKLPLKKFRDSEKDDEKEKN